MEVVVSKKNWLVENVESARNNKTYVMEGQTERKGVAGAACFGGHELFDQTTLFCGSDPHGE